MPKCHALLGNNPVLKYCIRPALTRHLRGEDTSRILDTKLLDYVYHVNGVHNGKTVGEAFDSLSTLGLKHTQPL